MVLTPRCLLGLWVGFLSSIFSGSSDLRRWSFAQFLRSSNHRWWDFLVCSTDRTRARTGTMTCIWHIPTHTQHVHNAYTMRTCHTHVIFVIPMKYVWDIRDMSVYGQAVYGTCMVFVHSVYGMCMVHVWGSEYVWHTSVCHTQLEEWNCWHCLTLFLTINNVDSIEDLLLVLLILR